MKLFTALGLAIGLTMASPSVPALMASAAAQAPIEAFTEQDVFRGAVMSGDGRFIAGIRREAVGDVLVVVNWETKQSTPVQFARIDQGMEIADVRWKGTDRLIFTVQQRIRITQAGTGVRRTATAADAYTFVQKIYSSDATGQNLQALFEPGVGNDLPRGISAQIVDMLPSDPDNVLIIAPDFGGSELRKVNVRTGQSSFVEKGIARTQSWIVDQNAVPVMRFDVLPQGRGFAWSRRGPGQSGWTEVIRFRGAEGANSGPTFEGVGPALGSGRVFVLARPDGKDTEGLYVYDTNNGQYVEEVLSVPGFDVSSALRDVKNNTILAACYNEYRWKCVPKEENFARTWRGLERFFGDQVNLRLISRAEGGNRLLLFVNGPQDFGSFYVFDAVTRSMDFVGGARPNVPAEQLPTQRVVHYKSRDGVDLWGYLWIPPGVTDAKNLPTIILPHGGPEGRDVWGRDPFGHWWAANGYAVFQPNFRGGGGFGRSFVQAGWRQWGQRMQQDVRDGADHLVNVGISDKNRVCIAGWSYGGYATMTGALVDGDLYKCAYAGAGVSDLPEMLRWTRDGDANPQSVRGSSAGNGGSGSEGIGFKYWTEAIGDIDRDREVQIRYSAARNAERINIPMFLIHGTDDIQVPYRQSVIMAEAMKRAGKSVEFITMQDEGHQWRPMTISNRRLVLQSSLDFFRKHIGPGVTAPTN